MSLGAASLAWIGTSESGPRATSRSAPDHASPPPPSRHPTMNTSSLPKQAPSGRFTRGLSWTLRLIAAAAFLAAGAAKLAGVPMMIEVFDHIGIGQWFRIVTGVIEI